MTKLWLSAVGIVCLTALEATAMLTGHDGTMFAAIVGAIAMICGVPIGFVGSEIIKRGKDRD